MKPSLAINAEYFLYGIESGLNSIEDAIAWADLEIENSDEPCGEIVDLALSRPRGRLGVLEALKEIPGQRNPQLVGSYLLADLKAKLVSGAPIKWLARKALDVASLTQQPEEVYFEFDRIDDELSLAEAGVYGTLEQCKRDLEEALSAYGVPRET